MRKVGKDVWVYGGTVEPMAGKITQEFADGRLNVVVFLPDGGGTQPLREVVLIPVGSAIVPQGPYVMWPESSPEALGEQVAKHVAEAEVRRLGERVKRTEGERDTMRDGAAAVRFPTDPAAPARGGES